MEDWIKTLIAALLVILAAAGARALDWTAIFGAPAAPAMPAPQAVSGASAFPADLPPQQALRYMETKKPVVVDIRTADEHAAGYLPATTLVLDYYAPDFRDRLAGLEKSAAYLLYCRSGHRSGDALGVMAQLGFAEARHIAGGIIAWKAAGLPVKK
ncbi:MAG: rhodanese-like domain-containing protein [Elusimicrobiales bacterium]